MLREKFSELVSRLRAINEHEMAKDIDEIIRSCGNYLERVNAMESCLSVLRFTMEPEDYRARLQELDKARKLSHNGLITNIKLLNRYCKLAEMDPIYDGDPESRIQIAEFAQRVVNEMFDTRKL